jgi:geranylgeranyl diphosphate synthase type II
MAKKKTMNRRAQDHVPRLLDEIAGRVNARLEVLLRSPDRESEQLYEAMRYSVLAGGKRFRPALVLLAAKLVGGEDEAALAAACAIEMVHTYSLIHDDLPAMDNDDLRRGRPTNHKVFGEALAILAGDALLTEAFVVLSRDVADGRKAARLVRELAEAAGAVGMVGGQAADLDAERNPSSTVTVETIHRRKTARMIEGAVMLGALVGTASERKLESLRHYGQHVGLAFQIADDILDASGTSESLGKTAGKDAAHGKRTYVQVYGLDESKQRARAELNAAVNALDEFGDQGDDLRDLARFCVEREH